MASDVKLPIAIFAALVALIAIPFLIDHVREIRRPVLLEARIVTATGSDPVFRNGRRRVAAGETAEAALALRIGRRDAVGRWISPVDRLAIDGTEIEHQKTGIWPEEGRVLRVFWFSVESSNLGGSLNADNAAERLKYRSFLAPEMGRGLRAVVLPEAHNDDHIGQQSATAPTGAGTTRLYARVEIVESDSDLRPLQAVSTQAIDRILEPGFPAIFGSADLGDTIYDVAGELFGLPGFEPRSDAGAWNEITVPAFGRSFTDLVSERIVVSSQTLAAVAVTGEPSFEEGALAKLGTMSISIEEVRRRGRALRWQDDVRVGDLLVDGDHWWVLLGDDGNGELDPADTVLHSWGRPPERTTLFASLETDETTVDHFRHAQ
jgi:hypothetical protein